MYGFIHIYFSQFHSSVVAVIGFFLLLSMCSVRGFFSVFSLDSFLAFKSLCVFFGVMLQREKNAKTLEHDVLFISYRDQKFK